MLDFFNKNADELKNKKLYLFDMDGTIYNDDELFDNVLNFFKYIKKNDGEYIFITNNSSKSLNDYLNKLSKMNIEVNENNFFTSTQATILYLNNDKNKNKKVYAMGTKSFIKDLEKSNIHLTTDVDESIDIVVVGYDTELNYQKLRDVCRVLTKNVEYIATNPDLACPTTFGFVPDCGSICQMIYNATNKNPKFIGKPEATMINYAINNTQYSKDQTVVVGDRLYTDILSGLNAGVTTICVLTGEATIDEILNGSIKPDYTFECISELYKRINN